MNELGTYRIDRTTRNAKKTMRLVMKLHNIKNKTSTKIKPLKYDACFFPAVVTVQDKDKIILETSDRIIVYDRIDKNVRGKRAYIEDSSNVYFLMDNFTKTEIEKIANTLDDWDDKEFISLAFKNKCKHYITRQIYEETTKKEKEQKQKEQQKIKQRKEQTKRQAKEYKKKSILKDTQTDIENSPVITEITKDKITQTETISNIPNLVFYFQLKPINVNEYFTYKDISENFENGTFSIFLVFSTALKYYKHNYTKIPNAQLLMRLHSVINNQTIVLDVTLQHKNNQVLIENIAVQPRKIQQVIDYIYDERSNLPFNPALHNTTFKKSLRIFLTRLQRFNSKQICVLQKKDHVFKAHVYSDKNTFDIPFQIGVDKLGWYVRLKYKYHLKWHNKTKRDIKHILMWAKNSKEPYMWYDTIELISALTDIIKSKKFENELIEYTNQVKVLNKI